MSALNRSQDQKGSLSLSAQEPFGFAAAARSHGWCSLAPFSWDEERGELSRVEELKGGVVVLLRMRGMEGGVAVEVESGSQLTAADLAEIREKVGWMLRLDEDLSEFYELCRNEPCLEQVIERKQGRLLRAPTLFEDVVKTVLTTNTTWPQTKGMVARLVGTLGRPFPPDPALHAFPSPRAIAEAGEKFLAREVRLGYRAPYIAELARRVVEGELDLEAWKGADLETGELRRWLKALKGVGEYAAANLLMCLGRYDSLPMESWARKLITARFFPGRERVSSRELAAPFDRFDRWKFLAYWFYDWDLNGGGGAG